MNLNIALSGGRNTHDLCHVSKKFGLLKITSNQVWNKNVFKTSTYFEYERCRSI